MSARACRGCGKSVVFAKDAEGKWQILDVVAPCFRQTGTDAKGAFIVERDPTAMVSHFATCPRANEFSAAKRRRPSQELSEPQHAD